MKPEVYQKIQSREVKTSVADATLPVPESIVILVTQRKNDSYRSTEILTFEQAVEAFDADPVNENYAFTVPRFVAWRQRNVPDEMIVAHSVAKLL